MKYSVDSKVMRCIDDYTINKLGIPAMELMERAAAALVKRMLLSIKKTDCILAVCGPGNNGGDGAAAARLLNQKGYTVAIALLGEEEKCSAQMKVQLLKAKELNIPFENCNKLPEYNIIIDAIFGVGLNREVTGPFEAAIRMINEGQKRVFAVDIPSGINADNGRVMNIAVRANETVTFGHCKHGLLLYPGTEYAGRVSVADIGFPEEATNQAKPDTFYYEEEDLIRLPERKNYSNKGTYGKVLIIAGNKGSAGAAILSAKAAYRSGAGLVKILSSEYNRIIIQSQVPEALFSSYDEKDLDPTEKQQKLLADLAWATMIVIGPGLGTGETAAELLETVIHKATAPVLLDADAINLLARKLDQQAVEGRNTDLQERLIRISELLPERTILTPHLLELSRLIGVPVKNITDNLIDTVRQCFYNSNLIYVAKDARTIVSGRETRYMNQSGNHGMATGGSGDVLTGIIAAFVAQGMEPFDAACLGVYVHGLSGDEAAKRKGTYSMMAGDIVDSIERVLINAEKYRSDFQI